MPRLAYSLTMQKWSDIRSSEDWIVYQRDKDISHTRPDGQPASSIGTGYWENALIGLATTNAEENVSKWYASEKHRKNMLYADAKTSAISVYVIDQKAFVIQGFNTLSVELLNRIDK